MAAVEGAAVVGAGLGAGASLWADAALRPGSQIFGKTVLGGPDPLEFALTYDDGPNDAATPELLDLLAEHEVRATFFMIGRFVQARPELARRVLAAGHVVGNHTVTHPWLAWTGAAKVREEMRTCSAILEDTLGQPVRYFRPPHGARRPLVFATARELGMAVVQWNVMGRDWQPIGSEGILRYVRRDMRRVEGRGRGANILLHDGHDRTMSADRSDTITATRALLGEMLGRGMRGVGVDAWG